MADTEKRLLKSRQAKVKIGKFTFLIRRPTVEEAIQIEQNKMDVCAVAKRFVYGWEDVLDMDIAPSGTSDPAIFSSSLWTEWVADRPDFWWPIREAVNNNFNDYYKKLDDNLKNSEPG